MCFDIVFYYNNHHFNLLRYDLLIHCDMLHYYNGKVYHYYGTVSYYTACIVRLCGTIQNTKSHVMILCVKMEQDTT